MSTSPFCGRSPPRNAGFISPVRAVVRPHDLFRTGSHPPLPGNMILSDSVTQIGSSAFAGCCSLSSLSMPSVSKIGFSAFAGSVCFCFCGCELKHTSSSRFEVQLGAPQKGYRDRFPSDYPSNLRDVDVDLRGSTRRRHRVRVRRDADDGRPVWKTVPGWFPVDRPRGPQGPRRHCTGDRGV